MSTMTHTPLAGDFGDNLAAFLAQVPAAADYDRDEMTAGLPCREHRPHRSNAKRRAIAESEREG